MVRKPKTSSSRPSFFKVLIKDYCTRLRLPPAFVQKYGKFLPENAKLRTSSAKTWNVKLDKNQTFDNYWCLRGGWSKFVKDLELKLGEFLVFWFNVGDSTFDVSVYGTNCCERNSSAMAMESQGMVTKTRSRRCIPLNESHHLRFQLLLKKSRKSRWCLPQNFAKAGGLIGKKAGVSTQEGLLGRYSGLRPNNTIYVSMGWNDFRKENGLEPICSNSSPLGM